MRQTKGIKLTVTILLVFFISHVPDVAFAEIKAGGMQMVSTEFVVEELNRLQNEEKVQAFLNKSEVQQKLLAQGVKAEEISSRLAALSNSELNQLSVQIEQAQYGGDILFTILIVVLIIYLVKRI